MAVSSTPAKELSLRRKTSAASTDAQAGGDAAFARTPSASQPFLEATRVGSVHFRLALAREVLFRLDEAQDRRDLSTQTQEVALRKSLKMKTLGPWPIFARQDNCQAKISVAFPGRRRCQHQVLSYASLCHRKRKSQIDSINVQGNEVVTHDLMADAHYMITTIA
jgi:hypothetical protein